MLRSLIQLRVIDICRCASFPLVLYMQLRLSACC